MHKNLSFIALKPTPPPPPPPPAPSPCYNNQCQNGATCIPNPQSYDYRCQCKSGYTGPFCATRKLDYTNCGMCESK